jgi:hypothetical protein
LVLLSVIANPWVWRCSEFKLVGNVLKTEQLHGFRS